MNNEQPTTEAEPKKPGDLTASIERMTACLEDIIANAKAALFQVKNMPRDGMKWMTLSKAVFDVHERSRMGWQKLVEPPGAFFTKPEALEAIMQNPPLNIPPAAEPIDPNAPKLVQGEKPFTRLSLVNIPELNIEFHNFYTADFFKAVCYWENKDGERRVYEITVKPWAATGTAKWRARAQVCGKVLFYLEAASKCLAIECALVAMRQYLIRSHRCALRTYRKAAKAAAVPTVPTVHTVPAAPHPVPLTPEEELADTIKRQKEAEAL